MQKRTIRTSALLCLLLLFTVGCAQDGSGFAVTETVSAEQIRAMIAAAEESLRDAETTAAPETESGAGEIVYWTEGGEVWHITKTCTSLKQADDIRTGSLEAAREAGKTRACKRCGN